MSNKVVAVAKRLLSCEPLHQPADLFGGNAQGALSVRQAIA
jgi:hypothetical protein